MRERTLRAFRRYEDEFIRPTTRGTASFCVSHARASEATAGILRIGIAGLTRGRQATVHVKVDVQDGRETTEEATVITCAMAWKLAEFAKLRYPIQALLRACTLVAVTTRNATWFKVRGAFSKYAYRYLPPSGDGYGHPRVLAN